MYRIRKAFDEGRLQPLKGPVEVDEAFIGGRRRQQKGRGPVGKTTVAGAKDRATGQAVAHTVAGAVSATLQGTEHPLKLLPPPINPQHPYP